MNNLMKFEGNEVEVFEHKGDILFNPKDVAKCLDIADVNSTMRNFNKSQVKKLTNSDMQNTHIQNSNMHSMHFRKLHNTGENFLTESGVYKLIFKSRKEEAEKFQDWVTDEVLPSIRQTGGYIQTNETDTDETIMAKAILLAQSTIEKQKAELQAKDRFINQIAASKNSLLVREVAKVISNSNTGIVIGERRLYDKLRSWGFICKNSTEPKQIALERGLFEVVEGTRTSSTGVFTYQTTRVTGKGQAHILTKLLKEQIQEQISMIN